MRLDFQVQHTVVQTASGWVWSKCHKEPIWPQNILWRPEQHHGVVFWNRCTECLRNIRNIAQTFVKQILLVLLRAEEEKKSVQVFDFSLIWTQKYSLCWFIHCSRVPGIKSLHANVDRRSDCNQSRINWTLLSKFGRTRLCGQRLIITVSDPKPTERDDSEERWVTIASPLRANEAAKHVARLPLDWPQLHGPLLCWHRRVTHNGREHASTRLEQLGAVSSLPSFRTIDFYSIPDELMFSEHHYCERVNVTLRFASNSLSAFHFILAESSLLHAWLAMTGGRGGVECVHSAPAGLHFLTRGSGDFNPNGYSEEFFFLFPWRFLKPLWNQILMSNLRVGRHEEIKTMLKRKK